MKICNDMISNYKPADKPALSLTMKRLELGAFGFFYFVRSSFSKTVRFDFFNLFTVNIKT